uniref:GNAT family N-acetyltransferase n=1 Tax=Paractinoplanes polyasparticus TaxID=2856853 RepID=UPI001C84601B|nr:GNAT family N-acetyltransferase [Actinoplanes polyasparticus]
MSSTSPTTAPALRNATEPDVDLVADIVADAFLHLDVIRYLVPNPQRRRPVSRAWYRLYIAHAINGAGHVILTADGSAAAVWFDRTREPTEPDDYTARLAEITGDDLPRFQHLDAQMDAHHPTGAHWHLLFLAVHPSQWGQALGSQLMAHTHQRLDADGIPAYLEATNPQNQRLYHHHGYTDMTPLEIPVGDSEPLLRLWRDTNND